MDWKVSDACKEVTRGVEIMALKIHATERKWWSLTYISTAPRTS